MNTLIAMNNDLKDALANLSQDPRWSDADISLQDKHEAVRLQLSGLLCLITDAVRYIACSYKWALIIYYSCCGQHGNRSLDDKVN